MMLLWFFVLQQNLVDTTDGSQFALVSINDPAQVKSYLY